MPTPNQQAKLAKILKRLRNDNPDKADTFRLSKAGESIAHFDGSRETGAILYSTLGDDVVSTLMEINGRTCGMSVEPCCYEGFPDPPKPTPRFAVGDPVRMKGRRSWIKNKLEDQPEVIGLVVQSIAVTQNDCDRSWLIRYRATDPKGHPSNYIEASEMMFEPERIACPT